LNLVCGERSRLCQNLAALDLITVDAAEQRADVVAGFCKVQSLAEHLESGDDRLLGRLDTDDFDFVIQIELASLDTARRNSAAARNREHVLNRHQERLVESRTGVGIQVSTASMSSRMHGAPLRSSCRAFRAEPLMIGTSSPGKSYFRQKLADFHLDQVEELRIIDHVALVQEDNDAGTPT
jgi:hypothetical protein